MTILLPNISYTKEEIKKAREDLNFNLEKHFEQQEKELAKQISRNITYEVLWRLNDN